MNPEILLSSTFDLYEALKVVVAIVCMILLVSSTSTTEVRHENN